MENTFDFNSIGKRTPYTVPDGFFEELEENVMAEVRRKKAKKTRIIKIAVRSIFAAAAAIALFFVVRTSLPKDAPVLASTDDFTSVEQAFWQLSADDQDFLIQVYEETDFY